MAAFKTTKVLVVLAGLGAIFLMSGPGCNKEAAPEAKPEEKADPIQLVAAVEAVKPATTADRLHQPFEQATITESPPEWNRPPDTTCSGKSVGRLYTEVSNLWDTIRFTNSEGKPIQYRATLETEIGILEISLRPDIAPNHVRSFVALARTGYYDGLVFERVIHEMGEGNRFELIEAGCPLGTGEMGYGSIGYWLKPEFNAEVLHDEGTVGASHGDEGDSSACKFYITLCPAPVMDGNYSVFGKVTKGLDVARKILSSPVRYPEGDLPVNPVVIRKVTIQSE